ncbi:MAG: OmpW family outer membrane protein, partial [Gammaproteobacteria bacterium]
MFKNNKTLLTTGLVIASIFAGTFSGSAIAADEKWKVRFRGIGILPDDSSNNITLNNTTGLNAGVGVDEAFVPELDITYMITPHWGVEAIAGIARHDVSINGNDATLTGLGIGDGFDIFDTWVLPPTVTLQYH